MTAPLRPTDFEPLARQGRTDRPGWFGFLFRGGWHLSIFPQGPKGKRTFTEFHVTREQLTGNKHHFYTADGHVQLNHLDNIPFNDFAAWNHANAMAAEFYQTALNLYVTPEMLQQELTTFQRRTAPVLTMDQHRAAEEARRRPAAPIRQPVLPTPKPIPVVAPPQIEPLPPSTLELHGLYRHYLGTLPVDDEVRRRWSDALDQLYTRLGRNVSVAQLKVYFDQVFTSGLSL